MAGKHDAIVEISHHKPIPALAGHLSPRKLNGNSKGTAGTAILLVISGSSAVNVSGTKPKQKPNSVNSQRKTRANNKQQTDKPRYKTKLVCQFCGKFSHSACDCRSRIPAASAYRKIPYIKQTTSENREFRRYFRQSQINRQPVNQITPDQSPLTGTNDHNDCYDVEYNDKVESNSKNL